MIYFFFFRHLTLCNSQVPREDPSTIPNRGSTEIENVWKKCTCILELFHDLQDSLDTSKCVKRYCVKQ